jgi:uncharacterized protein (TIGR03435 family)
MRPAKILAAVWSTVLLAHAQTPPPAFEVASIKRNASGQTRVRFETPPGTLTAVNAPLRFLIRQAYRVPESRISGGPSWLDTDRFDIAAKATSSTASSNDLRLMLRALLAERFGLALHTEEKEVPVYTLRVARADRKLGPNLRESSTDCTGRGPALAGTKVECGIMVSQGAVAGSLRGGATTLAEFTRLLGDFLERPLMDDTGLAAKYDLDLEFSTGVGTAVVGAIDTRDSPAIFTAIQEQLGLKLDSQRRTTEIYVIDRAAPPSEN